MSPEEQKRTSDFMDSLKEAGIPLGPTGLFPKGKLIPEDEGELRIAVGDQHGKVVIHFGKPIAWIGFTPQEARALIASIQDHIDRIEPKRP